MNGGLETWNSASPTENSFIFFSFVFGISERS
jgi:hypothetical protein